MLLEVVKAHGKEYPELVLELMSLWRKHWEPKEPPDTQLVNLSYRKKENFFLRWAMKLI